MKEGVGLESMVLNDLEGHDPFENLMKMRDLSLRAANRNKFVPLKFAQTRHPQSNENSP